MSARHNHAERTPLVASVLALLDGIERHKPDAPASVAFRAAVKRKGAETFDAVGSEGVERLLREVAQSEPEKAEVRGSILRAAWGGLLSGHGGRTR